MGNITDNFSRAEYACKCGCGKDDIKDELAIKVQQVRDILGRSITINSGIRCSNHNTTIKATPTSSHIDGWAADLAYPVSRHGYDLLNVVMKVFVRVGLQRLLYT